MTIDLGIIQIHMYSVCLFIAMLVAGYIILKEAKQKNIPENDILNMLFYTIIIGIIGARIYFVIFHIEYYANNILDIFKIWEGGLAIHGGIIAGLIFLYFYTKYKQYNLLRILDIVVLGLILAQAIGRWGNFFNGEAHGPEVSLEYLQNLHLPEFIINGMYINGAYYIPTFLIESVLCIIGFIIMFTLKRKLKLGGLTAFYLIWYGMIRFFIEGMRTDSLMLFSFKIAQIVSIIMIIIGIILFIKQRKEDKNV